jgi:hypothetical protein
VELSHRFLFFRAASRKRARRDRCANFGSRETSIGAEHWMGSSNAGRRSRRGGEDSTSGAERRMGRPDSANRRRYGANQSTSRSEQLA